MSMAEWPALKGKRIYPAALEGGSLGRSWNTGKSSVCRDFSNSKIALVEINEFQIQSKIGRQSPALIFVDTSGLEFKISTEPWQNSEQNLSGLYYKETD